jgi:hypothetical protein
MTFTREQILPGESIVLMVHPHLLTLARSVLLNLVALPLIGFLAWSSRTPAWLLAGAAPLLYLAWEILERIRGEYVITNRRVVKHQGIFRVTSFDAPLDKINNVFHEQTLLGRLVGLGDVGVETASEQGIIYFRRIPDPVKFKNCIVAQRESYWAQPPEGTGAGRRGEILEMLADLGELRDRKVITPTEFEEKKKRLLAEL